MVDQYDGDDVDNAEEKAKLIANEKLLQADGFILVAFKHEANGALDVVKLSAAPDSLYQDIVSPLAKAVSMLVDGAMAKHDSE